MDKTWYDKTDYGYHFKSDPKKRYPKKKVHSSNDIFVPDKDSNTPRCRRCDLHHIDSTKTFLDLCESCEDEDEISDAQDQIRAIERLKEIAQELA